MRRLSSGLLGRGQRRRGAAVATAPVMLAVVLYMAGQALADNLAPYGQNQGETHVNEDHEGQSLVYDNISGGNVNGCDFEYADLTVQILTAPATTTAISATRFSAGRTSAAVTA